MKIKDVIQHKGNQAVVTIGPEATVRELVEHCSPEHQRPAHWW